MIDAMSAAAAGRVRILLLSAMPVVTGAAVVTAGSARNGSARNGPVNAALRRIVRKPSLSYSGLPRSVANSVTVASPASASRCSIRARPSPMRPYRAATSIMPTEARSAPYLVSTTAPASAPSPPSVPSPPSRSPPSGASMPKTSDTSSSSDHLAFSGSQPRSTDRRTQCRRSSGRRRRTGGNGTPLRSLGTVSERIGRARLIATPGSGVQAAPRTRGEHPPFTDAPADRHHQVHGRGQRRERGDHHRDVRQHLDKQPGRAARTGRGRRGPGGHLARHPHGQPADQRQDREHGG